MTQSDELSGKTSGSNGTQRQHGQTGYLMSEIRPQTDPSSSMFANHHSKATLGESQSSPGYTIPYSYRDIDDVFDEAPVQDSSKGPVRQQTSREERSDEDGRSGYNEQRLAPQPTGGEQTSTRQRGQVVPGVGHNVPGQFVNTADVEDAGPRQNPNGSDPYQARSPEDSRNLDQDNLREQPQHGRRTSGGNRDTSTHPNMEDNEKHEKVHVSKLATQFFTISYLILFSLFGTLARLGLQALTSYHGAPVMFSSVWPNFAGSLVMGFLIEDRKLFRNEKGTPTYDLQLRKARQTRNDEESGSGSGTKSTDINLAAAKKAHQATKKTIPLYIGLATGFCGSFTSFSSFVRDIFLALSNDLPDPDLSTTIPRNGGYSFMAVLAVILTTLSLSLGGLFVGAHIAAALERFTPSIPYKFTCNVVDRVAAFLAFGCWIGAVVLSAVPPDRFSNGLGSAEVWRGRATFSLVFAPLGCLVRHYASIHLNGKIASFPLGTFAVNIIGTAILGMAWDIAHVPDGGIVGCQVLQGIEDGFCGCLTTVSTWVSELSSLRKRHAYIYGLSSVVVALACMVAIMGGLRWTQGFADLACLH